MESELQNSLYEKFPSLYAQHEWSIHDSAMPWGFECGDGWYQLIHDLSESLVAISKDIQAVQVKEKYGGLRFYLGPVDKDIFEEVRSLIDKAEDESYKICEMCGTREGVKVYEDGWVVTRCPHCK